MARIVLASGSPRRQELLQRIGIRDFTIRVPQVEEWYPDGLTPEEIVCYISREKSQAVPSDQEEIVITADTMVFLDDKKLGKPADESEALAMLTALQGRHHTVCTGVTAQGCTVREKDGGTRVIPHDTFVIAAGLRADADAVEALYGVVPETYYVGDCKRAASITEATTEAYFLGASL